MRLILTVYENALKEDFTESNENLKLAGIQLETMKNDEDYENISLDVLENIYNGTNCHFQAKLKNFEKVEEILKLIKEIDYPASPKTRSTLHGRKSLDWSKYNTSWKRETGKAIEFAKLAMKDNPEFAEWYFIMDKHFRSQRRRPQLYFKPCQKKSKPSKLLTNYIQRHYMYYTLLKSWKIKQIAGNGIPLNLLICSRKYLRQNQRTL
ncbi:uncharacterized protein LOC117175033 [Belonocnema kinseyi]|uniref:uncharacterized protein LOC117175033 n=1 Tax=Belonocnema kinseyi TaxID=2817044 RepID=UPI00143D2CAD|nr:uncharacterized protein LOC117175033 [Belonocnema kinseyi]